MNTANASSAKAEQEKARKRRAEQAEEMRHRSQLKETLAKSAKSLLGTSEDMAEEQANQVLRLIRDGLAEDIENLVVEIRRDVQISHKQKRLSTRAAQFVDDLLKLGSVFANRKRKLEEVEKKLGMLRRMANQGIPLPTSASAFEMLSQGCIELKQQIAELTQAMSQRFTDYSQTIHADRLRELSLRETFEECLEHLEGTERGKTEVNVRQQLRDLEYDQRVKALKVVVDKLVTSIPPMRTRLIDRNVEDAKTCLLNGDPVRAMELLDEARHYDPANIDIMRVEAACYGTQNNWFKASAIYKQVVDRSSANAEDAQHLISALERANAPLRANEAARLACGRWPEDKELLQRWGDLAWNFEQWEDAAKAYKAAVDADPNQIRLLRRYGCALVEAQHFEEGLGILREAVRKRDNNGHIHRYLGRAYSGIGQTAEALKEYGIAIEMNPEEVKNHVGRGWTLIQTGEYEEAIRSAQTAAGISGSQQCIVDLQAEASYRLGDYKQTLEILQNIATQKDAPIHIVYIYAVAAWRLQRFEEAERVLSPALQKFPENEDLRHTMGLIYLETGRMAEAAGFLAPVN